MVDSAPRILGGRYEVGELIGRGGMAEVHIGHDTRLGRTVAIKILRSDLARDPSFQARFRREAQAAASLNHPAIVAVYDTGEDVSVEADGSAAHVPFIVMEYVEGHTVRDILGHGAAVPIEEAVEITTGVLSALEYSHHAGIVHRDIKPANVMLTPTGAVKVMDFGIARAMADAAGTMTQTQAVIGTAQYLSPEQARGEAVDSRSDLYSTGCLLFELLTGRPPFVGDSPVAVAYQHARETAQPPSTFASDVPEALDRITMKALAKDREMRYASASEFRSDLEAALRGGYVSAPAVGALGAAAAAAPPGDATQVMGAPLPPTQVVPTSQAQQNPWTPLGGEPETGEYGEPEEDEPKRRWVMWTLIAVAVVAIIGIIILLTRGGETEPDQVEVPAVVGLHQDEARELIEEADLRWAPTTEPSVDVPKDHVVSTDPEPGELVDLNTVIAVVISAGPDAIEIPDVSGETQNDARNMLRDAGFDPANISVDFEHSPDIPRDSATRTEPPAGDSVAPDAEIVIFLSDGQVEIEDMVGWSEEDARSALRELMLSPSITYEESEGPPGVVLRQSRPAGAVEQRASIDLVISQERTTTTVPDVRGQTCDQAQQTLGNASLNGECELGSPGSGPPGTAYDTNPQRGTVVAEGTSVTVYLRPEPEAPPEDPDPED